MTKFEEWVQNAPIGARLFYGMYIATPTGPRLVFIEQRARATAHRLFREGKILLFRKRSDSGAFGLDYVAVRCSPQAAKVFGDDGVYDPDHAARKRGYSCSISSPS